jgi:hypothetical protein
MFPKASINSWSTQSDPRSTQLGSESSVPTARWAAGNPTVVELVDDVTVTVDAISVDLERGGLTDDTAAHH